MSSYLIGNLVGRLLMSAFLVWLILLCINRFNPGLSIRRLIRPLPLLSTFLLFILGLAGNAIAETHHQNALSTSIFPSVGVDEIFIPTEREWLFEAASKELINKILTMAHGHDDFAANAVLLQNAFNASGNKHYISILNVIPERPHGQLDSPFNAVGTVIRHNSNNPQLLQL